MPGDPPPAEAVRMGGGIPPKPAVRIHGELPTSGFLAARVSAEGEELRMEDVHATDFHTRPGATGEVSLDLGTVRPRQAALVYGDATWPQCTVFLPSLDFGGSGPLAWKVDVERTVLSETFTPHATVTVARVWRGRTAIPSRDSAEITKVRADGRLSFVHVRGEAGPLRLREVKPDGSVAWREVTLHGRRRLRVEIAPTGVVTVAGQTFDTLRRGESKDFGEGDPAVLAAIGDVLADAAEAAGRDEQGVSKLEIFVRAHPDTPFAVISWILELCAHQRVRIASLRFLIAGEKPAAVRYRLPADAGLRRGGLHQGPRPANEVLTAHLKLELGESGLTWTGLHLNRSEIPLVSPADWTMFKGAVASFRKLAQGRKQAARVTLEVQPGVRYRDVVHVLDELGDVGEIAFARAR